MEERFSGWYKFSMSIIVFVAAFRFNWGFLGGIFLGMIAYEIIENVFAAY